MHQSIYIGIDLGGTSIKMGMIDKQGRLLYSLENPTPVKDGYQGVIEAFDTMLNNLLKVHGYTQEHVQGIGIGVPAFLDLKKGIVIELVNLQWKNVPLKELLSEKWSVPIKIDNDANAAALGEMWAGAGKGKTHLLCITIGTGIGGGIIINGDIYHGVNGMAGEVGHITVREDEAARTCNCGKKGCLETEASATAIVNDAIEKVKHTSFGPLREEYDRMGSLSAKSIIHLAKQGDRTCTEIIQKTAHILGKTLAQMCYLINPETIVIGGGVSHAGDLLFNPLKHTFNATALPRIRENTTIVPAKLGNHAGMIGAAWLIHRLDVFQL